MKLDLNEFVIREYTEADAPSLAKYANNPEIARNLRDGFPHPYGIEDARRFIRKFTRQEPVTAFAIANTEEVIGGIGFAIGEDVHRFTAELGYWLAQPFWNRGIVTRAVVAVTDYAFDAFGLHRIFADPYEGNPASMRVLEKAGFEREGVLRASAFKNGQVLNQVVYAKIR